MAADGTTLSQFTSTKTTLETTSVPVYQSVDISISTVDSPTDPAGTTSEPPEGLQFIFVPLGVVILVIVLSALVFLLVRKKRLDRLRHHLMPLYNFDPAEEGEDWETELLEEGVDHRSTRRGYKSMEFPPSENTDLFRR